VTAFSFNATSNTLPIADIAFDEIALKLNI
jgi:hypothetical protein